MEMDGKRMAKRGPKGPSKYKMNIDKEAEALLEYAHSNPLPFFNKFCVDRGYYPKVADAEPWKANENFTHARETAKAILEYNLAVGGLTNKLNHVFAIFALKNVAGWRDVQSIDQSLNVTQKYVIIRATKNIGSESGKEAEVNITAR